MNKTIIIIIAVILVAGMVFAGCSNYNAAPSSSTSLTGPSVSLSGSPYITAGPSSTVTINVTPLPNGTQSTVPTPPNSPLAAPSAS